MKEDVIRQGMEESLQELLKTYGAEDVGAMPQELAHDLHTLREGNYILQPSTHKVFRVPDAFMKDLHDGGLTNTIIKERNHV